MARARSASESAPPETAHAVGVPGAGNVQRGRSEPSSRRAGSGHDGGGRPDTVQPALGGLDLRERGKVLGPLPGEVEHLASRYALDRRDELLTQLVLRQLRFETDEAAERAREGRGLLAALVEDAAEALGGRDTAGAGAAHRHVTVALEQRHHPGDLTERDLLLVRRDERCEPAELQPFAAPTQR